MSEGQSVACVFALICGWPALWMFIAVKVYQRYSEGGWRAVIAGKKTIQ